MIENLEKLIEKAESAKPDEYEKIIQNFSYLIIKADLGLVDENGDEIYEIMFSFKEAWGIDD